MLSGTTFLTEMHEPKADIMTGNATDYHWNNCCNEAYRKKSGREWWFITAPADFVPVDIFKEGMLLDTAHFWAALHLPAQ